MPDYWARRKARAMHAMMEDAEKTAKDIAKVYNQASLYLSQEAESVFERFREKHSLSDREAWDLIGRMSNTADVAELKQLLGTSGLQNKADVLARLEAPAYQYRISQLINLHDTVDSVMQHVYKQEKAVSTEFYKRFAEDAYYRSIFDVQCQSGYGFAFGKVDPDFVDLILNSNWSGKNYDRRIWNNTQALGQTLKRELLFNYLTGRSHREMAEVIAQEYNVGKYNARRLVRTESNYLSGQMDMHSYERCGIKRYLFVAVLDLVTSELCRDLDGEDFAVSEREVGKNCNPMHPWCRSTTIAFFTRRILEKMKRAARDPKTGKTVLISADMTYRQWYDQYVKGNKDALAEEAKLKERKPKAKKGGA